MNAREQMWERVYSTSNRVYRSIDQYEDEDSMLTADAAVAGWYGRSSMFGPYRKRRLNGLRRMPNPGNMLNLGCFRELEWVMPNGEIRGLKFAANDRVPLLWSDDKQALLILPYMKRSACVNPPRARENRLAQRWARGRSAQCSSKASFGSPPLPVAYPGIQISYRSDKFGAMQNYIHHFEKGVVCYFSSEPYGARRAPKAIFIRGGHLSLQTHGIHG